MYDSLHFSLDDLQNVSSNLQVRLVTYIVNFLSFCSSKEVPDEDRLSSRTFYTIVLAVTNG